MKRFAQLFTLAAFLTVSWIISAEMTTRARADRRATDPTPTCTPARATVRAGDYATLPKADRDRIVRGILDSRTDNPDRARTINRIIELQK